MKKTILKSALISIASVGLFAGSAMGMSLDYYTGDSADSVYTASGAEYFKLTDFTDPQSTPTLQVNSTLTPLGINYNFGIYSFDGVSITSSLTVLDTYNGVLSSNVIFDTAAGTAWATSRNDTQAMSTTFGYFLDVVDSTGNLTGESYYSDSSLSTGGYDFFYPFYDANGIDAVSFAEVAIGFGDANTPGTALFSVNDIEPVPEPATMMLFGLGVAGLAGFSRRKRNN